MDSDYELRMLDHFMKMYINSMVYYAKRGELNKLLTTGYLREHDGEIKMAKHDFQFWKGINKNHFK